MKQMVIYNKKYNEIEILEDLKFMEFENNEWIAYVVTEGRLLKGYINLKNFYKNYEIIGEL